MQFMKAMIQTTKKRIPGQLIRMTLIATILLAASRTSTADERFFTYSYEANVLAEGQAEFEQWLTHQNGRRGTDYAAWNLRTELEYGLTNDLTTAVYLNWDSVREGDESDAKFKGISSEWIYRLLNPHTDAVGLAVYGEYSTDGVDNELEGKILLSKPVEDWNFVLNAIYEAEWEKEDGETEHEATLQLTAGASYRLNPKWAVGIELRNKSAYPDGFNLKGQEYNTLSVGPNVHYGNAKWWATFTVLPQLWGNGDGSNGGLQTAHEERFEARLIFGIFL